MRALGALMLLGAAVYAVRTGLVPAAWIDAIAGPGAAAQIAPAALGAAPIAPAAGVQPIGPVVAPAAVLASGSDHIRILEDNDMSLSTWAADNLPWVAAILMTENYGLDPAARGSAGEVGLMQVKPGTAQQMFDAGYSRYQPTEAALATVQGGLYFGTSYLDWLSRRSPDRDWITKAYNGGPGFASLSAAYVAERERYLLRVKSNFARLGG